MISKSALRFCVICDTTYSAKKEDIRRCPKCGLLYSGQKAGFGNPIQGMSAIAIRNYAIVADALKRVVSLQGAKILDVGCAEGGFTELMLQKGASAQGLEPDREAAQLAIEKKLPVELVSFEDFAVRDSEYDVIVFNDVFEHMHDPVFSLKKSFRLLKDKGLVLINLPVSSGFIFRISGIAARFGIVSPYRRIWAKGLSSPHIYFYNGTNLAALLLQHRFKLVDQGRLVALSTGGMYQRVRSTYDPLPASIISFFASLFILISGLFPADVKYFVFMKNESQT